MIVVSVLTAGGSFRRYENPKDVEIDLGGVLRIVPNGGDQIAHLYSPTAWSEAWTEDEDE